MTNPQDEKTAEKFTGGNTLELVTYQAGAVVRDLLQLWWGWLVG